MDGTQQPRCQNCNEPLTVKQLLVGCVHLNRVRTQIYPMSASMNEQDALRYILGSGDSKFDFKLLLTYLAETGFENIF